MGLDPIILGSLISGGGGLLGGYLSNRASEPMRREALDLTRNIGATSALRQTSIRDLLRGYAESGVNSPLINLINSGLLNYFQPTEDIAGTPEYKMTQANIRQNYEEAASGILNTLAARGAIRSGTTQLSLEHLGRTRLAQEREAYVALSALRDQRMQAAVKAAIDIVTGSSTEEAIAAMSGLGTAATTAGAGGEAIATGAGAVGQAVTLAGILRQAGLGGGAGLGTATGVGTGVAGTTGIGGAATLPVTGPLAGLGTVGVGSEALGGLTGVGEIIPSTLGGVGMGTTAATTGAGTIVGGLGTTGGLTGAGAGLGTVEGITGAGYAGLGAIEGITGAATGGAVGAGAGILGSALGWTAGIGAIAYPLIRSLLSGYDYPTAQQATAEAIEQAGMGGITVNAQEVRSFFDQMGFESEGSIKTDTWQNWINAYYAEPRIKTLIDQRFGGLPVWLQQLQAGWQSYLTSPEWVSSLSIGGGA